FCSFFSFSRPKSPSIAVNVSGYAWQCRTFRPFGIRVTSSSVVLPLVSAEVCRKVTLSLKIGFIIVLFIFTSCIGICRFGLPAGRHSNPACHRLQGATHVLECR